MNRKLELTSRMKIERHYLMLTLKKHRREIERQKTVIDAMISAVDNVSDKNMEEIVENGSNFLFTGNFLTRKHLIFEKKRILDIQSIISTLKDLGIKL